MGDTLAHLETHDGNLWVQGALLAAGLARVRPTERNPEMAAQMSDVNRPSTVVIEPRRRIHTMPSKGTMARRP